MSDQLNPAPQACTEEVEDNLDSVASMPQEGLDEEDGRMPINDDGTVPKNAVFRFGRYPRKHDPRGFFFAIQNGDRLSRVFFVSPHTMVAEANRDEVVFERGRPGGGVAGGVDFHHWILNLSSAVMVHDERGNTSNLKRLGMSKHSFQFGERTLFWRQSMGASGNRSYSRSHLECTDEK